MDMYSIGIATGDITPEVGAPLSGFAARGRHTSTGVYHPLRTVAFAMHDGQTPVILVSAEIVFFESLAGPLRAAIRQETGVPDAHIVLCATHTHCGPSVRTRGIEDHGWIDHDYVHQMVSIMARTSAVAWKNRFDARLKFGTGRCGFAVSRRKHDPNNPANVLWAPDPQGPHDHEVSVLSIEDIGGVPRGILFSYACHPTSRAGLLIGGDYPGFAYDRIQDAFGFAQPAFLQGCGADQKPMPADPNAQGFSWRTIEQTKEIGHQLGDAVIHTIESGALQPVTGALAMRQSVIELMTEPLDKDRVAAELDSAADYKQRWAQYHKHRMEAGLPEDRAVPMEIQTLRFGNSFAVVALAAEAVVEYALRMKRDLSKRFSHVLPLGYANDVIGYVPVKRQWSQGGYEVLDANQYRCRTGRFMENTENRIHGQIDNLLGARGDPGN